MKLTTRLKRIIKPLPPCPRLKADYKCYSFKPGGCECGRGADT